MEISCFEDKKPKKNLFFKLLSKRKKFARQPGSNFLGVSKQKFEKKIYKNFRTCDMNMPAVMMHPSSQCSSMPSRWCHQPSQQAQTRMKGAWGKILNFKKLEMPNQNQPLTIDIDFWRKYLVSFCNFCPFQSLSSNITSKMIFNILKKLGGFKFELRKVPNLVIDFLAIIFL